jgi:hypothetical protein
MMTQPYPDPATHYANGNPIVDEYNRRLDDQGHLIDVTPQDRRLAHIERMIGEIKMVTDRLTLLLDRIPPQLLNGPPIGMPPFPFQK